MLNLLLLCGIAWGQESSIAIDRFYGLNDTDSPATLTYESPSLLNVETNISGTALLKRKGYSREASLTIASGPVTGSYSFFDNSGNRQTIVCQDNRCLKSTNGAAFSVLLTTNVIPTRWSFVDVNGSVYIANDKRTAVSQWNGSTLSNPAGPPLGTDLELTKDRLAVSGTTANPNRVAYSQSGTYTNFTTGPNPADPWTDDFGTSGDKINAIKYDRGRIYVFKLTSITACLLGDQYTTKCFPISSNIGTNDSGSVISGPDGIYFKGQDGNFWRLDDGGLVLLSKTISTLVKNQSAGSSQSNTQSTQPDWQAGISTPTASWDTSTIPGSLFPSSATFIDTIDSDFTAGTIAADGTNGSTQVYSLNGQLLSGGLYINSGFNRGTNENYSGTTWTIDSSSKCGSATTGDFAAGGAYSARRSRSIVGAGDTSYDVSVQIINSATDALLYSVNYTGTGSASVACNWKSIDVSTQTVNLAVQVKDNLAGNSFKSVAFSTGNMSVGKVYYGFAGNTGGGYCTGCAFVYSTYVDFLEPWPVASSTFTSQCFNTTFSTPTWGSMTITMSSGTANSATFTTKVATSCTGSFDSTVSISNGARITSAAKKAVKYTATYVTSGSTTTATINDVNLVAATTGLFQTQCIQPGPNITSWGSLNCSETKTGAGSLTYYMKGDNGCAYLSTGSWTAHTNNATITLGLTNPVPSAVQIRFDSSLPGGATDQAQVDACTMYWNNGVSAQPVWGAYDSTRNALFWTASVDNSSTTNRTLKYDLNLDQWFPWDIPAQAPRVIGNQFYFGSGNGGYWYKYGGVDNDDGAAISSNWTSKDFSGGNPFNEATLRRISLVAKNQGTGSLTGTWTTSNGATGNWTISESTTTGIPYIRSAFSTPLSSPANFTKVKLSNSAANQPFEILGLKLDFMTQPWRPLGP